MLKKLVSISFVTLVNILILAHAVIPHHNHEGEICITDDIYKDTCHIDQNDCCTEHSHSHHEDDESTCCNLQQAVFTYDSQLIPKSKSQNLLQKRVPNALFAVLVTLNTESNLNDYLKKAAPPSCFFYENDYIYSSGLRAPPCFTISC